MTLRQTGRQTDTQIGRWTKVHLSLHLFFLCLLIVTYTLNNLFLLIIGFLYLKDSENVFFFDLFVSLSRCFPHAQLTQPPCLNADDELPGHASFLLLLSVKRKGAARAGITLPGFSSPLIGQQGPPFRHGSRPPWETASASRHSRPWNCVGRYHSCHVVIPKPLTLPL